MALSAFESFYQRAEGGQFPQLNDRDDLWQLLVVVTVRKAIDLVRHEGRPTRGSGRVLVLSELVGPGLEEVLDPELTPELAVQMAEECRRLYGRLGDDTLCAVARWKMEGHTNAEIAAKLGCVRKRSSVSSARSDGFGPKRSRIDGQRQVPGRVLGFRASCE